MLRLLIGINAITGLVLFYFLSGISANVDYFKTNADKISIFLAGAMLFVNVIYLAFLSETGLLQRRE